MKNIYGSRRAIGSNNLPVYAWRVDNGKTVADDEALIHVKKIHMENSSFNQICIEAGGKESAIKEMVMNIVKQRGKLHNPYTQTAGLIVGRVEKLGCSYHNRYGLKAGDEVLVLVSASMIPLHLDSIKSVNYAYGHLDVEGYGILYDGCPVIKKPEDISWDLLMVAFEESASIYKASKLTKDSERVLLIGSNPIVAILYGIAVRKSVRHGGKIVSLFYSDEIAEMFDIKEEKVHRLFYSIFDEVYFMDGTTSTECTDTVTNGGQRLFDVTVNCADQMGAEGVSVMSTRKGGSVFFSSLSNNYNTALFIQEAINREMDLSCAVGYNEDYSGYMMDFLRSCKEQTAEAGMVLNQLYDAKRKVAEVSYHDPEQRVMIEELMIYKSAKMKRLVAEIDKAAKYDCPVVIVGESGVGKEVLANLIHKMGSRKTGPYIKVNCAAIPKNLMESEFFGYEKGAFTGASGTGKKGYFDLADGGILLFDEIAEMPVEMQAKLLRVIQEGEFYRIGGQRPTKVDVRIMASTNKDLIQLTKEGKFREDLYYRLAVITLEIPPLREREEDIIPLAERFIEKYCRKYGIVKALSEEGVQYLLEYRWNGNIRELENIIQRVMINSETPLISSNDILTELNKIDLFVRREPSEKELPYQERVDLYEKNILAAALAKYGSTRKAAESLQMTQSQFSRKKKKFGIE